MRVSGGKRLAARGRRIGMDPTTARRPTTRRAGDEEGWPMRSRLGWVVLLTMLVLGATSATASAGTRVSIGINLGGPPALVAVPGTPVAYAPALPVSYFGYGRLYYVYGDGLWYSAPWYNGPWTVVAPAYVPRPLLALPVRYYRPRAYAWPHWRYHAPRWAPAWGRDWSDHGRSVRDHRQGWHQDDGRGGRGRRRDRD